MSTQFGYGKRNDQTCDRLVVRYLLPDGAWQATRVLLTVYPDAELRAKRFRNALRAEGKIAEVTRFPANA